MVQKMKTNKMSSSKNLDFVIKYNDNGFNGIDIKINGKKLVIKRNKLELI